MTGPRYPTLTRRGHPFLDFLTLLSSPLGFRHMGGRRTNLQLSGLTKRGLRSATAALILRRIATSSSGAFSTALDFLFDNYFSTYQPLFFS